MRPSAFLAAFLLLACATASWQPFAAGGDCLPELKTMETAAMASSSHVSTTPDQATPHSALEKTSCTSSGGGGGGSYQASWQGQTYEERTAPLERFAHFPVAAADSAGRVHLTPLSYKTPRAPPAPVAVSATDAQIDDAAQQMGWSRAQLATQVDRLYVNDGDAQALRQEVRDLVMAGLFNDAFARMQGTYAHVQYWCGSGPDVRPQNWVITIPAILSCPTPSGMVEVRAVTSLDSDAEFHPAFDPNTHEAYFIMKQLNLTTEFEVPGGWDAGRASFGVGYADLIWSVSTVPAGGLAIDANIVDPNLRLGALDPPTETLDKVWGFTYWNATGGSFAAGDSFVLGEGPDLFHGRSITAVLAAPAVSYAMDYKSPDYPESWTLTMQHHDSSLVGSMEVLIPLRDGHSLQAVLQNQTSGITIGEQSFEAGGGLQRRIALSSPTADSFRDAELKGTYFDATGAAQFALQFKGLPGDEEEPYEETFPSSTVLRVSLGTPAKPHLLLDLTSDASGHYRAAVFTSYNASFPFSATGSMVRRALYGMATGDPISGDAGLTFLHGAALFDDKGNSTFATSAGFAPAHQAKLLADASSPATVQTRSITTGCSANCTATLTDEARERWDGAGQIARFWAISDAFELSPDTCGWQHPSGGCL